MRARAVVLALAIGIGAARRQRPPTSWSGGSRASTPRRTRRSERSSPPSSRRPASRSSSSNPHRTKFWTKVEAALAAGHRRISCSSTISDRWLARWAYEDRLVELGGTLGPVLDLFDADALEVSTVLDGKTGRRGLYALPMGRGSNSRPCLEQPAGARGLHAREHPQGVGDVLVVLVRPGATGGTPGYGPRRCLGRGVADVGVGRRHRR